MNNCIVVTLMLWLALGNCMTTDQHGAATKGVERQVILPPNVGQVSLYNAPSSRNQPMLQSANALRAASSEVTQQQVEDQINQLNEISQQLRALPQSPAIEQTTKGQQIPIARYLSQETAGLSGPGMSPVPALDTNYLKKISRNPLTGPNGLTKSMLSDLMFGNLKSLASSGGLSGLNNPMEENTLAPQVPQFPNTQTNGFVNPMLEGRLSPMRNSPQMGIPSIGLPLPPMEDINFSDLPEKDLEELRKDASPHPRRHSRHKSKKKDEKSDAVTKLLLTLLVDKLKDIYEMDKLNNTLKQKMRIHSSTIGKIGNILSAKSHSSNLAKNDDSPARKDVQSDSKTEADFATNLSFPLAFSDIKGSTMPLFYPTKRPGKENNPLVDVDTKSIEKIITKIESGERKSSPSPGVSNNGVQIKGMRVDPGNSPQEISQKTTKTINNNEAKTGSTSEFHRVKAEMEGLVGKSGDIPSISDYHPVIEGSRPTEPPSTGDFYTHKDKATVSTLPTFSISSLLNQGKSDNNQESIIRDTANNPNANSPSPSLSDSSVAKVSIVSPSIHDQPGPLSKIDGSDTGNYLEASRVLGAVFNKVKDPLARKSVETAIKAMLKLMKSGSATAQYAKKESVPSREESSYLKDKVKKLILTIHELSKTLNNFQGNVPKSKKRHRSHKHKKQRRHSLHHKRHSLFHRRMPWLPAEHFI